MGCREASSSLVARSKLRKSPKAMKKALGLFSCARQTFSSLSHRNRCAGFRREPCTFPIRQDGDFPLEFSKVKTGCFREKKLFSKQTGKRERRVPCVIQINGFQNFLEVLKSQAEWDAERRPTAFAKLTAIKLPKTPQDI